MTTKSTDAHAIILACYREGRISQAEQLCRSVLDDGEGYRSRNRARLVAFQILSAIHSARGELDQAVAMAQQAIQTAPDDPSNHGNLGRLLLGLHRYADAVAAFDIALKIRPHHPGLLVGRGVATSALDSPEAALAWIERALVLAPGSAGAQFHRANALYKLRRFNAAITAFDHALALKPDNLDARTNRGSTLHEMGRSTEALAVFDQVLEIKTDARDVDYNRGVALHSLRRYGAAVRAYARALAISPDHAEALNNLGATLRTLGRHSEAIACFECALAVKPNFVVAHSNRIFALDLVSDISIVEQQAERRRWYQRHGAKFAATCAPHLNTREPARRLVIGYVSSDFRDCSAATAFGPVLRLHDKENFRTGCYSGTMMEDDETARFRRSSDLWRSTIEMSDDALAVQIRADEIDILVDLSSHMRGNRLLVFARKPAPIQVTAWGNATGTGLRTINYIFVDPIYAPTASRPHFAEVCYDLPCAIPFEPPSYLPTVADPPAINSGVVTFGCLNRFSKITPEALVLWANILRALPGSKLLLKDKVLDDSAAQFWILNALQGHGVPSERVILRGGTSRVEHLATYGEIDIALDPFPHGGGISTWESLWMGVPVVTKRGTGVLSHVSASILTAVGLSNWVARDDLEYTQIALARAADADSLAHTRLRLRERLHAAKACDLDLYTRAVEAAYRTMWRSWCESVSSSC